MKKRLFFIIPSLIILAIALWLIFFNKSTDSDITVKAKHGKFKISVTTTGELRAKNSIDIRGPSRAQQAGIYEMKISKLVDEGVTVKEGDFVAELDRTDIMQKIKDVDLSVQKIQSQLKQAKLDSTLELSSARDNLENLKFDMEEKKLLLSQSVYEPPSIKRQAEINYERSKRAFEQAQKNYKTKVQKSETSISIVNADLSKELQKMDLMMQIMNEFTIKAPADGMVIYAREWGGRAKVVGSVIRYWDPVVAKLPDLTVMESATYVNEVDIQKIQTGQMVDIGLDADPDKEFKGKVVKVANIGEQKRDSKSKVFEVIIEVVDKDSTLLPAMTTSNEILIDEIDDVTYIPLETVHSEEIDEEKILYVYKNDGSKIIRQEVKLGPMNENDAIVEAGISEGDELLLSVPEEPETIKLIRLEKDANNAE